jgi:hypothetical protein
MANRGTVTLMLKVRGDLVRDETGTWCGWDSFLFHKQCNDLSLISVSDCINDQHTFIFQKGR